MANLVFLRFLYIVIEFQNDWAVKLGHFHKYLLNKHKSVFGGVFHIKLFYIFAAKIDINAIDLCIIC